MTLTINRSQHRDFTMNVAIAIRRRSPDLRHWLALLNKLSTDNLTEGEKEHRRELVEAAERQLAEPR